MPTIVTSAVLDAPPAEVWPLLRDFAAIGSWRPVLPGAVGAGAGTLVEWSAGFDCDAADEEKVSSQVREGILLPGLAALSERFADRSTAEEA